MTVGRIVSLSVSGFRNLWEVSELKLPTLAVFLGGNGTGKSALLEFLEFIRDIWKHGVAQAVRARGEAAELLFRGKGETQTIETKLSIAFGNSVVEYVLELAFSSPDSLCVTKESWHRVGASSADEEVPPEELTQSLRQFWDNLTLYRLENIADGVAAGCCEPSDCEQLQADGRNLAAVLADLKWREPQRYRVVVGQTRRFVSQFDDFVLEPEESGKKLQLRWRHRANGRTFQARQLSKGSLRFITLVTLLNMPKDRMPSVLCLDEPELGLHPWAMSLAAEMMKIAARSCQVLVATQSPLLPDEFELENIVLAGQHEGKAQFFRLERRDYQRWLDAGFQLSDIWLSRSLGGRLLFEKPQKSMDDV